MGSFPPDELVNLHLALGSGYSVFGFQQEAEASLNEALALAERHGLGERIFKVEAAITEISRPGGAGQVTRNPAPASADLLTTVQRVEALEVAY